MGHPLDLRRDQLLPRSGIPAGRVLSRIRTFLSSSQGNREVPPGVLITPLYFVNH
jgi:hypothetical protein